MTIPICASEEKSDNKASLIDTHEIEPYASYSIRHELVMTSYITAYPTITVDANTGKIGATSCPTNNSHYITLYNVRYNETKTTAYFTVTVYEKSLYGGIDHAIVTKYDTVHSAGPR